MSLVQGPQEILKGEGELQGYLQYCMEYLAS
jgi:hypothetical protein